MPGGHAASEPRGSRNVRRRAHARIVRAIELLQESDLREACRSEPPHLLLRGIEEFNQRKFFEQHETLETLWRAEHAPIRFLYQGILQLGVAFLHLGHGNMHGAVVKLENGIALLQAFEPTCQGVDVRRLRREAWVCLHAIAELGPERLGELDWTLAPMIHMRRQPAGGGRRDVVLDC